jgi:ketosteroid isomerase-like protein
MRLHLASLVAAILAASTWSCSAFGSGNLTIEQEATVEALMSPIRQYVAGFNVGDMRRAFSACTDPMIIIDEIPPYAWSGEGAALRWGSDFLAHAGLKQISSGVVTLGEPRHVELAGDRAYVVVPADYDYQQAGDSVSKRDCTLTVSLVLTPDGWRISGWTWTSG